MKNTRLIGILGTVGVLLCIPLVAMQFTNEVNWTLSDFIIAGGLLLGTGLLIEVVTRTIKDKRTRIGIVVTLLIVLVLVWAELAVGFFWNSYCWFLKLEINKKPQLLSCGFVFIFLPSYWIIIL